MQSFDEMENSIIETAKRVAERAAKENWSSDRDWTRNLVSDLGQLGNDQGFHACGAGCPNQGEWLYDVVWLKLDRSGDIVDMPLIVESEWSINLVDVEEDFYKLLVGRAQHRVMIFQQRNVMLIEGITRRLTEIVAKFKRTQAGDRYLFVGLSWDEQTFKANLLVT